MRFLFFGQTYAPLQTMLDAALAATLRQRGHETAQVYCSPEAFSVCDVFNVDTGVGHRSKVCKGSCVNSCNTIHKAHGVSPYEISTFWSTEEQDAATLWAARESGTQDLLQVEYRGYRLFEMAKWSIYRYLKRVDNVDPNGRDRWICTEMMKAARLTIDASERLFDQTHFDRLVIWNGINMSQRIAMETARKRGITFFAYEVGLNRSTIILAKNQPAVPIDFRKAWSEWKHKALTEEENQWVDQYLNSRKQRLDLALPYGSDEKMSAEDVRSRLGIPAKAKIVPLFTNLNCDTSMEGVNTIFKDQEDWIRQTANFFENHPDHVCVVRIHPAEILKKIPQTHEPMVPRIKDVVNIPNVRVINPETVFDSYALMEHGAFGITYVSTVGIEMACENKAVLTSGYAHYHGAGFSWDPTSQEEYFHRLQSLVQNPAAPQDSREFARRYAHLFFRLVSMKLDFIDEVSHGLGVPKYESYKDLEPGKFPSLDRIVDVFLDQREFIPSPDVQSAAPYYSIFSS